MNRYVHYLHVTHCQLCSCLQNVISLISFAEHQKVSGRKDQSATAEYDEGAGSERQGTGNQELQEGTYMSMKGFLPVTSTSGMGRYMKYLLDLEGKHARFGGNPFPPKLLQLTPVTLSSKSWDLSSRISVHGHLNYIAFTNTISCILYFQLIKKLEEEKAQEAEKTLARKQKDKAKVGSYWYIIPTMWESCIRSLINSCGSSRVFSRLKKLNSNGQIPLMI